MMSLNLFRLTRGQCRRWPGKCEHTICRYHILSMGPDERDAKVPEVIGEPCTLALADAGCMTLEEIGITLGITRERARQIEDKAMAKIKRRFPYLADVIAHIIATAPDGPEWPEAVAAEKPRKKYTKNCPKRM